MKKESYIVDRKSNRGESDHFFLNFLGNFARCSHLVRKCAILMKDNESLIKEAKRSYIISLVSCIETFYHDLFVHILSNDKEVLEEILNNIKEKPSFSKIYSMLGEGVSFPEIAASKMTYQSIEEVENTFSTIFKPNGYLNQLDNYKYLCVSPFTDSQPEVMTLQTGWRKYFGEIFKKRHSFVHDANMEIDVSDSELQNFETIILQVVHFTTAIVSTKYSTRSFVSSSGNYFFLTADDLQREGKIVKKEDRKNDSSETGPIMFSGIIKGDGSEKF